MSLPPERISIKRRRQDDPVDTLVLEKGASHDHKRRFTEFIFRRINHEKRETSYQHHSDTAPVLQPPKPEADRSGIPVVHASQPGDEVKDFIKYRASQKGDSKDSVSLLTEKSISHSNQPSIPPTPTRAKRHSLHPRRFHLTHDISSALKPNPSGGIRRSKFSIRPPIATFIERVLPSGTHDPSVHRRSPVDKFVQVKIGAEEPGRPDVENTTLSNDDVKSRTETHTFVKPRDSLPRDGKSIRDDPATWDLDSDQLANELAALALDMDPDARPLVTQELPAAAKEIVPIEPESSGMQVENPDDFIYETYIRVQQKLDDSVVEEEMSDADIGILVIDQEDEELWERYIRSDDDSDYDEEDEDSNAEDNPRNDYPEDEVSTDDEFGTNVYKYHNGGSDDDDDDY